MNISADKEEISQEKAIWYIHEYFQRFSSMTVPHLQRLIKAFKLEKRIPKLFMTISRKSFGTNAGFVYEFPDFLLEYRE